MGGVGLRHRLEAAAFLQPRRARIAGAEADALEAVLRQRHRPAGEDRAEAGPPPSEAHVDVPQARCAAIGGQKGIGIEALDGGQCTGAKHAAKRLARTVEPIGAAPPFRGQTRDEAVALFGRLGGEGVEARRSGCRRVDRRSRAFLCLHDRTNGQPPSASGRKACSAGTVPASV